MSVHTLPAREALARLDSFSTVIDARSESEHALDRIPGAVNWPVLNDEERSLIGTMYRQVSPFEAKKRGAALVARNVAAHIERELLDTPKNWQPLVYCWRGGNRSGAMATILGAIGFRVTLIEGGYKAYRQALLEDLPRTVTQLKFRVVCGRTGTGKTHLLQTLSRAGAQVLDLEALAEHRSSVLGLIPGRPQPSQKHFDTRLWQALRTFDPAREVYIEAESKRVGNVALPESLVEAMRTSPCLTLDMPLAERVELLLRDYAFFTENIDLFCERLATLTALRGREMVARWQAQARAGDLAGVVRALLDEHYDPKYEQSMAHNFTHYTAAPRHELPNGQPASFEQLAATLRN